MSSYERFDCSDDSGDELREVLKALFHLLPLEDKLISLALAREIAASNRDQESSHVAHLRLVPPEPGNSV